MLLDRLCDSEAHKDEQDIDQLVDAIWHDKVDRVAKFLARSQSRILLNPIVDVLHHEDAKGSPAAQIHEGEQKFEDFLVVFKIVSCFFREKVTNQEKDERGKYLGHI